MKTLYDRLKHCRSNAKLTQQQLAKAVGVSHVTISQWERGDTTPKGSNLYKLAKVLDCSAEWLLYGQEAPVNLLPATEVSTPFPSFECPLVSWQQIGNIHQVQEELPSRPKFSCPVPCSTSTFVLQVQGVSMEPEFQSDDLIFIDPKITPQHGSFVIVRLAGQHDVIFRQLVVENDRHYLKPQNPSWPDPIRPLSSADTVLGTLIFAGRPYPPINFTKKSFIS
ncbi:S24 family peptidase [Celerinatantimonas sp. YJH-8]|uniref:S24 family peptidase n=1 Tax=Celerinatantimonas sp. YJH-8 TaxID=3228714 RepID=UPI0038BF030C